MRASWRPPNCCAGWGDIAEMGALLAQAVPPVTAAVLLSAGPELTGRVVTYRWPAGGPPAELLGPSGQDSEPVAETGRRSTPVSGAASRCTPMVLGVAGQPGTAAVPAGRRRTAHGTGRRRISPAGAAWRVVVGGVIGRLIR